MKTLFLGLLASILFFSSAQPTYALFGQKQARAEAERRANEAEQRANEATSELSEVKTKAAADQKTAQDEIREWEAAFVVVIVGTAAIVWYVFTFCRTVVVRSPAHEIVAKFVVIDAANVVRSSQGDPPSLLRLIGLLVELEKQKFTYKCFFDANTMYVLKESGLLDEAKAYRELLRDFYDVFIEVPGKTRADDFILDYAHKHGTPIISNDQYRDFAKKYAWIENSSGRRVPFKAHSSTVQLVSLDMEAKVPASLSPALNEYCTMLRSASAKQLQ